MERNFGDYKQAAADNFLREIRVTHDKKNIYFLIKTDSDITLPVEGKTNWMNLFIGVDGSKEGSWESYNFVCLVSSHRGLMVNCAVLVTKLKYT